MIKGLDNRFYVKFMQLEIGLLVGALSSIIYLSVKRCIKLLRCDSVYVETGDGAHKFG